MPIKNKLSDSFTSESYSLASSNHSNNVILVIRGQRRGRPSKRLTFHSNGLKVLNANIQSRYKNKEFNYEVKRINHIPTFQEIRLHTSGPQFPGDYTVTLEFSGQTLDKITKHIKGGGPYKLRQYFPVIDELPSETLPQIIINQFQLNSGE